MKAHFPLNELKSDEFGRPSGVLAINKPAGITSHDVVDKIRKILDTRKVGHAGALDPFATGVLIILVGKATKASDEFIATNKEYLSTILFGIGTDSADTEGRITGVASSTDITNLSETLTKFTPEYEQFVSVYSSVKVNGEKLRVLARKYAHHNLEETDQHKYAIFYNETPGDGIKVDIPKHACKIPEIEIIQTETVDISDLEFYSQNKDLIPVTKFNSATIRVQCSKGTYIRTLAEDIGKALPISTPAMLIGLQRTKVGSISLEDALEIDEVKQP